MKSIIWRSANILGIPLVALRCFLAPRILLYHGVTDRKNFPGIENYRQKHIPVEEFDWQLRFLKNHFRIVPLDNLIGKLSLSGRKARGMAAITFDDGYRNIFRVAWPLLQKYNLPFTIFFSTDFVDKKEPLWVDRLEYAINFCKSKELETASRQEKMRKDDGIRNHAKLIQDEKMRKIIQEVVENCGADLKNRLLEEPDYAPLEWQEIRQMLDSGLAKVGCHTKTHAIATRLSLSEFYEEVLRSKRLIEERTASPCFYFAYPNGQPGDFSEQTASVLAGSGFKAAFTTEAKFVGRKTENLAIPRFTMDETEERQLFLATISGVRRFLKKMRGFSIKKQSASKKTEAASYFDNLAADYELAYSAFTPRGYSFRIRRQLILEMLAGDLGPGAKILDIGCGPGVYTRSFLERGFTVWGFDPAPEMIKIAETRFKGFPDAHFAIGRIENPPFSDIKFDSAIAAGLFEYLVLKDLKAGLEKIHRLLLPGGILIVSFPYFGSLPRIWDRFIMKPLGKTIRVFRKLPPKIDSREFSTKEAIQLLEQNGFIVQKIAFYNSRFLWTPLDRLFPKLAVRISQATEALAPAIFKTGFIVKAKTHP